MLSWFDVAYAALELFIVVYCFKNYYSSKKKFFQLFGLGFICLTISDFVWIFAVIPWSGNTLPLYGYIRLVLFTAFIVLILRALQVFNSSRQTQATQR